MPRYKNEHDNLTSLIPQNHNLIINKNNFKFGLQYNKNLEKLNI